MGKADALTEAKRFKTILLSNGVPEVSIELMEGRPASGDRWNNQFVVSDFAHHTVSRYGSNKTPCLSLVKNGRSDLPGPLCNGYGGWDLCARIICLGYANHPGTGGPLSVPSGVASPPRYTIPKNNARKYAFGWEFEGGLNESDWAKTLTNPRNGKKMTMHEFMARCLNGTQEMYGLPYGAHAEHSTWTSRKIDRLRYTRQRGIDLMKKYDRPAPPSKPWVDVSNCRDQFRIALGLDKGKVKHTPGVATLQRTLNAVYPSLPKLAVTGLADQKTADRWGHHEKVMGGTGRIKVPDMKSTQALAKKSGGKFQVAA